MLITLKISQINFLSPDNSYNPLTHNNELPTLKLHTQRLLTNSLTLCTSLSLSLSLSLSYETTIAGNI
jgi:hypothetical protein